MKKFICIVLTVVLALSCMSAFAAEPLSSQEGGTTAQESITPFWVNTLSIIPSISGSAGTYSCSINGVSGTTKISATLVLYEKGWLGGYTEVARTSHTTYSASFFKSDSYSFSSGKTYKLEVSGTVTRNGYAEPVSATIEQKIELFPHVNLSRKTAAALVNLPMPLFFFVLHIVLRPCYNH